VVMVNNEWWHECLAPERVGQFVDDLRTKGMAALTGCHLHVEGRRSRGEGRGSRDEGR
jgi:hypothetical protein